LFIYINFLLSHRWISKFQNNPPLEANETMCSAYLAYHLSNLRNLNGYLSRRIYLKLQTGGPRAMGSVEKGIKRPKCVAQKLLKKVNRTQRSSGVNRCDLVYGASAYPFPLILLYFRRWFTIGATVHLCFSQFFFFFYLLDNVPRPYSNAAMHRGTSSATLRNFRSCRFRVIQKKKGNIFYRI